eukprot:TRINITY_DN3162_c0_g1_i3.p1 TRINITY_DN3162_c0_g1~~TRINITY_DN3162_c0_g1_i3.p1  ORF type:complete len:379 (-),score=57.04 TRINITY_DN3162_c0_g1_i3:173-1309(-)
MKMHLDLFCSCICFSLLLLASGVSADTLRGLRLQLAIPSLWRNLGLRVHHRRSFKKCAAELQAAGHSIEQFFFMGSPSGSDVVDEADLVREIQAFGDIVMLNAPEGDKTQESSAEGYDEEKLKVLDSPSPRGLRLAATLDWIFRNRPDFDYVIHVAESSLVNLPLFVSEVVTHQNSSLVLGWLTKDSPLGVGRPKIGEEEICELCEISSEVERFCLDILQTSMAGMDFQGCVQIANRCCPSSSAPAGCSYDELVECTKTSREIGARSALYYGTAVAPQWPHGAGFVLGRNPVEFVAENKFDLRLRSAMPDILLGFWLAALEDLHFVSLPWEKLIAIKEAESCPATEDQLIVYGLEEETWPLWSDEVECGIRCKPASVH